MLFLEVTLYKATILALQNRIKFIISPDFLMKESQNEFKKKNTLRKLVPGFFFVSVKMQAIQLTSQP